MIKEFDVIKLKEDAPQYNLKKGQRGAVVMVYGDPPEEVEVEFVNEKTGKTLALVRLLIDSVEVVGDSKTKNDEK